MEGEGIRLYEEWVKMVHPQISKEPIWKFYGYRKALYLFDIVWMDTRNWFSRDSRAGDLARQLVRSTGSISANLEEGFGRGSGKDKSYHYRVALASARETKGWIFRSRSLFQSQTLESRLELVDEIISLIVRELDLQNNRLYRKSSIHS